VNAVLIDLVCKAPFFVVVNGVHSHAKRRAEPGYYRVRNDIT
jgi:hypothetical protein